jgi:hypothetical protein
MEACVTAKEGSMIAECYGVYQLGLELINAWAPTPIVMQKNHSSSTMATHCTSPCKYTRMRTGADDFFTTGVVTGMTRTPYLS